MPRRESENSSLRYVLVALMLLVTIMVYLSPVKPIDHVEHQRQVTKLGAQEGAASGYKKLHTTVSIDEGGTGGASKVVTSPAETTGSAGGETPAPPKSGDDTDRRRVPEATRQSAPVEVPLTPEPVPNTPEPLQQQQQQQPPASSADADDGRDAALQSLPSTPDELTKPLYATAEEQQWRREYQTKFRELGVKGRMEFLTWLAENKEKGIPMWRPGRSQPIVCDDGHGGNKRGIHSGYYSIPTKQMVSDGLPEKKHDWSLVIPGLKKTYRFKPSQEDLYLRNMQESRFAISFRKGGWQSGRTLEIFGAAAIPYFCDIWESPREGTMANFPREVMVAALQWEGIKVNCFPVKRGFRRNDPLDRPAFNDTLYNIIGEMVRKYSAECLTTPYIARYLLSSMSLTVVPKKVLIVWTTHPLHPGYMVPAWMMGMKELGVTVVDYPRQDIVYDDADGSWGCKDKAAKSWGRGFFVFCRVPENDVERQERKRISEALEAKEYDAVIYQIPHESYLFKDSMARQPVEPNFQNWPFFNQTQRIFGPKSGRILFAHDGDMLYETSRDYGYDRLKNFGRYMRRETHGCKDKIWAPRTYKQLLNSSVATLSDDTFP